MDYVKFALIVKLIIDWAPPHVETFQQLSSELETHQEALRKFYTRLAQVTNIYVFQPKSLDDFRNHGSSVDEV